MTDNKLLIVGCGYVGKAVAAAWHALGGEVAALTRGAPESLASLAELRLQSVTADWLNRHASWPLPFDPDVALVAVPHREDERFQVQTHVVGLQNLLQRCPRLKRLIVLSTTGVYHQNDGSWVDEQSPTQPTRIGPQIALAAEQWLHDNCSSEVATSLRLAGIYGPGRVPLLAKLRSEEPIPVGQGSLNLIHLDDIVTAIVRLLTGPVPSRLYVLSDGAPIERKQFYLDAARVFQTPAPQFVAAEDSSRAARSESNKRVSPARILRELNLSLKYPNHLSGLEMLFAETVARSSGPRDRSA